VKDNKSDLGWSFGRPTIHVITATFYAFYVYFFKSKKMSFTFFALLHTFSRTMMNQ